MRYRIDMSYDGAEFCGWQIQPQEPSVQEVVERALGTLLRARVQVTGAGRTDTGVSASCYVAHFDFDGPVPQPLAAGAGAAGSPLDCSQLRYKLNAILPKSVSVSSIAPVAPDFHARFGAVRRRYTYYLHRCKDPFCERVSYYFAYPEFDVEAMNRAAAALLGTHDFSCFEKSGGDNKTSVCTVYSARWEPYEPEIRAAGPGGCVDSAAGGEVSVAVPSAAGEPRYWRFVIEADRFLRNMVRAIVGTLLEVGRGRRSEADFASLVLPPVSTASAGSEMPSGDPRSAGTIVAGSEMPSGDPRSAGNAASAPPSRRSEAGESVPGHALFLSGIDY